MSYGRGGAGNIAQIKPKETELQPIGQKSSAEKQADNLRRGSSGSQKESEAYFYSGRGGAGNLVASKAQEGGNSPTSSRSDVLVETNAVKPEPRTYGRGGAGNFDWSNAAEKEREEALKQKMDQIRQTAERDVDIGLAKPGKAFLRASKDDEEEED